MYLVGEQVNRVFLHGVVIYLIPQFGEPPVVWSVQIRVIRDLVVFIRICSH